MEGSKMSQEETGTELGAGLPIPEFTGDGEKAVLTLPVGSFGFDNQHYREVKYGPLTGIVRKKIGRPDILNKPGKLITAALAEILEFPHIELREKSEKKLMVRTMYSADRAACVLAIRRATKKNKPIVQRQDCPFCGARIEISTSPDDMPVTRIEDTEYELVAAEHEHLLTVKTSQDNVVRLSLSRGFTEEALTQAQIQNINEASQEILASCTKDYNGQPVTPEFYDKMVTDEPDEITETFIDNQPGPDTLLEAKCSTCERTFEYGVDPSDFLLPSAGRKRYRRRGGK
jgi:hypothetical protein